MLVVWIKDDTDHLWNVTQNNGVLILNNYDVDHAITTENSLRYIWLEIFLILFISHRSSKLYDFQKSFWLKENNFWKT